MNAAQTIRDHFEKHDSITPTEAWKLYQIERKQLLDAIGRMFNDEGYKFKKEFDTFQGFKKRLVKITLIRRK